MSCCSSSAERIRKAADSRYPAISCRIDVTSSAFSCDVSLQQPVVAVVTVPAAAAAAADDDDDDDALLDKSLLTLRSVGADTHTNVT